jgi:hypothetical protein
VLLTVPRAPWFRLVIAGQTVPGIIETLHHSHQVLAYAYDLDDQKNLTLWVYDCNDPFNDSSTIILNIADHAHTIDITANDIVGALGGGVTIRGIFRAGYGLKDPTGITANS